MSIKKNSLVEIAMERIKQHIADNHMQPGDKFLSEGELTDQLQVSRTVIREALRSLGSLGIIEVRKGGGVYVAASNFESIKRILRHHHEVHGAKIKELVEIRKIIELGALRLIIEKDIDVDADRLEDINKNYRDAISKGEDTKGHDQLFHQHIMKEADNQTFYNFADVIHDYFSLVKINLIQDTDALLKSYQEHDALISALKDKKLAQAHRIMSEHFEPIFQFIRHMEVQTDDGSN